MKTFHLSSFTGETSSQNIKKSSCYLSKLIENSFKERQLGVLHLPTEGIELATQGFGPFACALRNSAPVSPAQGFPGREAGAEELLSSASVRELRNKWTKRGSREGNVGNATQTVRRFKIMLMISSFLK